MNLQADVAIVGSGFGGSLTALLFGRLGLCCVLIDRARHPRFAIGESSTPVADLVLHDLAREYQLPRLAPLARYGTWQQAYPEIVCGRKRGFSYFQHLPQQPFQPTPEHCNELLVAASSSDELSDTHWLRADVDAFLVREAEREGAVLLEETIVEVAGREPWKLVGTRQGQPVTITATFLVDASGEAGFLAKTLGIANQAEQLTTNSRAIFGHFRDLKPWHDVLSTAGGAVEDHPYYCDHAALHQLFEEGWMWQLRFENGVTSAGFSIDDAAYPLDTSVSAQDEWDYYVRRYPSLAEQFAGATRIEPPGGLRRTGRLQRLAAEMAAPDWVMLPNTAGFIDALHSSGIAHTLCGVERLAQLVRNQWQRDGWAAGLARYAAMVRRELQSVDRLVSLCYRTRHHFPLFSTAAMLYFLAATVYERRRQLGVLPPGGGLLCAEDCELWAAIEGAAALIDGELMRPAGDREPAQLEQRVAALIAAYNTAGLCDPRVRNMYRRTALPASA